MRTDKEMGRDLGHGNTAGAARPPIVPYAVAILRELITILEDRGANYADIDDNSASFTAIMQSMGVTLPEGMTPTQFHCMANIATKQARFATGNRLHEDSFLDIANYSVLIAASHRRDKDMAETDIDRKQVLQTPSGLKDVPEEAVLGKNVPGVPSARPVPWQPPVAVAVRERF